VGALLSGAATIIPLLLIALFSKRSDTLILGLAVVGLGGFAVFVIVIAGIRSARVKAKVPGATIEVEWGDDAQERQPDE
jgi:hypothetical protein